MTRREFVRTTAAAGAGLALAASQAALGQSNTTSTQSKQPMDIALIGFGAEGRVLLESILKIDMVRLVAVVDIWPYARKYAHNYLKEGCGIEVRTYENYEDLLKAEKTLKAVVVATPDFWHAPITNACLESGLHVYCEKMMSNTIEGARSMVQTMRKTGKLLQIGHQRRSNPRYMFALSRLLHEAKICGRLTAANAQWNRAVSEDFGWPKHSEMSAEMLAKYGYKDMHQFRNWRWFRGLGGGPLSDLGAHQIDIFNWYFGMLPKSVMASGGMDYYKNHEWYDNVMVIYEFPLPLGVARAFYQVQTTTSAGGGYYEMFMGDEGSVKMSEDPSISAVYREARAPSWDEWIHRHYIAPKAVAASDVPADAAKVDVRETAQLAAFDIPVFFNKAIHQPHLENFFKAIRGEAKLNCPADEAFRSEYIIHKANEAIPGGKVLEIDLNDATA